MTGSEKRATADLYVTPLVDLFRPSVGLAAADFLARVRLAPDPTPDICARSQIPALDLTDGDDELAMNGAIPRIPETVTLKVTSGPGHSARLNVRPDSQVVALHKTQIAGGDEDAGDEVRVRKATTGGAPQRRPILLAHGTQTDA